MSRWGQVEVASIGIWKKRPGVRNGCLQSDLELTSEIS